MVSVFVAGMIATAWDCPLDEGGVHSCVVLGHEIGGLLYSMGVMGWLFLVTMPSGLFALVVLLVVNAKAKREAAMALSLNAEESVPNSGTQADG